MNKKELSPKDSQDLLNTLKVRFEQNQLRHPGLEWSAVQAKLEAHPEKLWSLNEMERTGGEPDVVAYDGQTDEFIFCERTGLEDVPEFMRNGHNEYRAGHYEKRRKSDSHHKRNYPVARHSGRVCAYMVSAAACNLEREVFPEKQHAVFL